jgi:cytokinin dehydrogenase
LSGAARGLTLQDSAASLSPMLSIEESTMTPDRRTLLRAGFGVTAAFASRATAIATPVQGALRDLPKVQGEFSCDANLRAAAAEDFGHIIRKHPLAVLKPSSSADIAGVMQWAANRGLKVAARGQGHSTYGRPLADGGIVIDMGTIRTIGDVQPDRITVDAGATWADVLDAALAHGRTPPVLTNYLALSIGGTIAVGGIGGSSSRHGMQSTMFSNSPS